MQTFCCHSDVRHYPLVMPRHAEHNKANCPQNKRPRDRLFTERGQPEATISEPLIRAGKAINQTI